MLAYIHVMPLARCVRHANNKDLQNDVPHSLTAAQNRCIMMHQIHAKNGTPEVQFLETRVYSR